MIDIRAVSDYLKITDRKELPESLFEIIDIEDNFPIERVGNLMNGKNDL